MTVKKKGRWRPLLAADIAKGIREGNFRLEDLRFPLWVSPKYDGIRGLHAGHEMQSRKLKRIPARHLQERYDGGEDQVLWGIEGELIFGDPLAPDVMQMTTSAVMSEDKDDLAKRVNWYVFDYFLYADGVEVPPYRERLAELKRVVKRLKRSDIIVVEQTPVNNVAEFLKHEEYFVSLGFEGIMARRPDATYKKGRSTLDEQFLLKFKRFEDAECKIVGYEEGTSNQNEQTRDERGYSKRSKKAEGMVPNGTLGRLLCRDEKNFPGYLIKIGSGPGLSAEQRAKLWAMRKQLIGEWMTYRFQRQGIKDGPRFPRYVSLRNRKFM